MLLCPAPATTISKRSSLDACWPMENGVTARGARAAVFTNPRRLILLMRKPPRNNLLSFLLHHFFDAGPEVLQHHRCRIPPRAAGHRSARMRRRSGLVETRNRHAMLCPALHGPHCTSLRRPRTTCMTTPMPVVRVHAFQIQRTLDDSRENLV